MEEKEILTNDYRQVSDEEMLAEINEHAEAATDFEIDEESLVCLGGMEELPPATTGTLTLLEIIKSPFLTGETCEIEDIYKALYVIYNREKAVSPLLSIRRAEKSISLTEKVAEKSPEFYEKYLNAIIANAERATIFEKEVLQFGDSLGVIDYKEMINIVKEHIFSSYGGFAMIPASEKDSDVKKKAMMPTG